MCNQRAFERRNGIHHNTTGERANYLDSIYALRQNCCRRVPNSMIFTHSNMGPTWRVYVTCASFAEIETHPETDHGHGHGHGTTDLNTTSSVFVRCFCLRSTAVGVEPRSACRQLLGAKPTAGRQTARDNFSVITHVQMLQDPCV